WSSDVCSSDLMYLRTIYELMEEGIAPLRARIAERLEHSGPTGSQTVARMERDGLLHVASDRRLELTEEGLNAAATVMRKHRLSERLLADVICLYCPYVHEGASRVGMHCCRCVWFGLGICARGCLPVGACHERPSGSSTYGST